MAEPTPKASDGSKDIGNVLAEALQQVLAQNNPSLRENRNYTPDSVFHPRGTVKTPWTRRYFFAGVEQEWAQCTPEEADLFERLKPGKHHIVGDVPRWSVEEKTHGSTRDVWVDVPCRDVDQQMSLPSLRRILREIVYGEPAD